MKDWIKNIFDEETLKSNIQFAALFVLNYECLKDFAVNQLRDFYCDEFNFENGETICVESDTYKKHVRKLDKHIDNASMKWFLEFEAILKIDYVLYQKIRRRRNDITHELLKNISNGFTGEDITLFHSMIELYQKLDRWWINEIEIPISGDGISNNYDRDEVIGGQSVALSAINDIILGSAGDSYQEMLKELDKVFKGNLPSVE